MSQDSSDWTTENEDILNNIRLNCNDLEDYHKSVYFVLKKYNLLYKIPILILSSVNGIVSIFPSEYISQPRITLINCGLSFIISTISSIAIYLKIDDKLENEMSLAKQYHLLSIDIYKTLIQKRTERSIDGPQFTNDKYNEYIKLFEKSNILKIEFKDNLKPIHLNIGISSDNII
jgi:hypothetical protein